jgi:hypothetical protein
VTGLGRHVELESEVWPGTSTSRVGTGGTGNGGWLLGVGEGCRSRANTELRSSSGRA